MYNKILKNQIKIKFYYMNKVSIIKYYFNEKKSLIIKSLQMRFFLLLENYYNSFLRSHDI